MTDRDKVFDAFRNCITEPKCRDCPWEQCEQFNQKKVTIPVTLALDVLNMLKEQESVKPMKRIEENEWTVCGFCENHIISKWAFCPYCGRSVKWE